MPAGVCLVETRTPVNDVTVEGLGEAVEQVERAAMELASAEVDVILQAGTAIAFFRGFGHDAELTRRITATTGIKATTSLTAVVEALRVLGIKQPAIATSYIADIDARLVDVLEKSGFAVAAIKGMPRANTVTLICGACTDLSGPGTGPGFTVSNEKTPALSVPERPQPRKSGSSGFSCLSSGWL